MYVLAGTHSRYRADDWEQTETRTCQGGDKNWNSKSDAVLVMKITDEMMGKAKTIKDVMQEIANTDADVLMQSRRFPLPMCRAVMYDYLRSCGVSINRIGILYGKSHCTIMNALKKLRDLLETRDAETMRIYNEFHEKIHYGNDD